MLPINLHGFVSDLMAQIKPGLFWEKYQASFLDYGIRKALSHGWALTSGGLGMSFRLE